MRRLIKFLHSIGAIWMMGAMACLLVLLALLPEPTRLMDYASMRAAMAAIAGRILLPSLTLVAGLLAMAATSAYRNAGWALIKLATGVLVFEAGFAGVVGPMQDEAERSAAALAGTDTAAMASLAQTLSAETGTSRVLMAIAALNVALGVWRPRLRKA
ncbi:hypothetical protein BH11PSE4_BH11PSE4_26890 [soil metagenome]